MSLPRWFLIACCLLVLNLGLVISSAVWRQVAADEPPVIPPVIPSVDGAPAAELPGQGGAVSNTAPHETDLPSTDLPSTDLQQTPATAAGDSPDAKADAGREAGTQLSSRGPLDSLPLPESLPEIPSLADPATLQNDPVFQEFRKLFSEATDAAAESSLTTSRAAPTTEYFQALDQRLQTVEQLCGAARGIAADAARFSRDGDNQRTEELLKMATQLRDMAAQLLVSELP